MRLRLTLAYDGTGWQGWQWQPPPAPTVQRTVEGALGRLVGEECRVVGSGRTDAGVHAHGQVAHVDVPERPWDWSQRLNALLPPAIVVVHSAPVEAHFHARKDAVAKTYHYDLWPRADFMPPPLRCYAWGCGPVNKARMAAAALMFLGCRDFASFQNSGTPVKSTERTIEAIDLQELSPQPLFPSSGTILRLSVRGTGFLKQMVRNMVGFLVAVGRGKCDAARLPAILAARNRTALPTPTAPAHGLCLAHVHYGGPSHVS